LGYSDDSAYRRDKAARVLLQVPTVADKVENGSLNLTQLTQVQKCLNQKKKMGTSISTERTAAILQQLENKNNFESQKIIAVEFNQPVQVHEALKPQKDDSVRLEITLTADQLKTLQQAKDLLSHVLPDTNWSNLFVHLAEKQIDKVMGKKNSSFLKLEERNSNSSMTQNLSVMQKRRSIRITTKRLLLKRANQCCEFVDTKTGRRCESAYQLQIDHRVPFALGGIDNETNYRLLCRSHNLLEAQRWGLLNNQKSL
jgi:5-methylcytosine-specific restriction endonuclease McrA